MAPVLSPLPIFRVPTLSPVHSPTIPLLDYHCSYHLPSLFSSAVAILSPSSALSFGAQTHASYINTVPYHITCHRRITIAHSLSPYLHCLSPPAVSLSYLFVSPSPLSCLHATPLIYTFLLFEHSFALAFSIAIRGALLLSSPDFLSSSPLYSSPLLSSSPLLPSPPPLLLGILLLSPPFSSHKTMWASLPFASTASSL